MENSFKIGDKVKILPKNDCSLSIPAMYTSEMQKYAGKIATIIKVTKSSCKIDLDDGIFFWPYEALQLVTSETNKTIDPHELKNGDYIKITNNKSVSYIYIFREIRDGNIYRHAAYSLDSKAISVDPDQYWSIKNDTKIIHATEEERKLLDNILLEWGYKWNDLTKQLEDIRTIIDNLKVQPVLHNSIYGSIQRVDSIFYGTPSGTKEEKQTEIELNLFPKKKHYQLNFNY